MLSVREMQLSDVASIIQYWLGSDATHLLAMGVDLAKVPSRDDLAAMLQEQIELPLEAKRSYGLIWELEGRAIGHSNTNPTYFGDHAFMHLHLWGAVHRKKGLGTELVQLSLPHFFSKLQLEVLYCQPYALNPAPNKTLAKAGFEFLKEYITVPGSINLEQSVKLWKMSRERFDSLALTAQ
ncbi:MAG TPA: GNAT family protein [Saprospiraceae bacterium]|nr:GNAT family protein [Saprospiraceae bacterium]HMQ84880.1 GNAT family protein [Saprospiraceae bacterium]